MESSKGSGNVVEVLAWNFLAKLAWYEAKYTIHQK